MTIHRMERADLDAVKALLDCCFSDAWSKETLLSLLENEHARMSLMKEDEKVIGFLAFETVLDEGVISELCVRPASRRKGVAKALIEDALTHVELKAVTLEVRASNLPAIALYRSLGFDEVGRRANYYTAPKEDAILMTKQM